MGRGHVGLDRRAGGRSGLRRRLGRRSRIEGRRGTRDLPLTYAELAPAFEGSRSLQEEFLSGVGVAFDEKWRHQDSLAAFTDWHEHIGRRRHGDGSKRPIADTLIGAFSSRFDGLVTRNTTDFRTAFPYLELLDPSNVSEA